MNYRLLAILLILLPGIRGLGALTAQSNEHGSTACCSTIETTTCCGQVAIETICARSGGECECAARPTDLPAPAPISLFVQTLGQLYHQFPELVELSSFLVDEQPQVFARGFDYTTKLRTHNDTQAILGIWRL